MHARVQVFCEDPGLYSRDDNAGPEQPIGPELHPVEGIAFPYSELCVVLVFRLPILPSYKSLTNQKVESWENKETCRRRRLRQMHESSISPSFNLAPPRPRGERSRTLYIVRAHPT